MSLHVFFCLSSEEKNLKQEWLLAFWNKIQTHKKLNNKQKKQKKKLFIMTQHKCEFSGEALFSRYKTTLKQQFNGENAI